MKRRRSEQQPGAVSHFFNVSPWKAGEETPAFPGCDLLDRLVLESEDGQYATLVAEVPRVAERAERAQTGGRIFGADARSHADTGPAANAREHGHVLLAIGTVIGHRVADDA